VPCVFWVGCCAMRLFDGLLLECVGVLGRAGSLGWRVSRLSDRLTGGRVSGLVPRGGWWGVQVEWAGGCLRLGWGWSPGGRVR